MNWYQKSGWIIALLILFFPVGLFLMWKFSKWNKYVKWGVTATLAVFVLVSFSPSNSTNTKLAQENKPTQPQAIITKQKVEYNVVYSLSNKRYDKGKNFYVLIDSIDLSSDAFKKDIKVIVKEIVAKEGGKISIDILDNKDTLELVYKSHYGSNQLGRILTKSELEDIAMHLVASFTGQLDTMLYKNQLDFFPGASKDTPKVGDYQETLEFNP